jgi:hypothetical protein
MIGDSGFSGQPSRFNERFKAGSQISAQDLNGLATGITATTPQFYLGDGPQISLGSGGVQIVDNRDIGLSQQPKTWRPRDNRDGTFSIWPGTLNSLIPNVGDWGDATNLATARPAPSAAYDWSEEGECFIYLSGGPAAGSGGRIWPSSDFTTEEYPLIYGYSARQNDDDSFGYILLALAQKDPASEEPNPPVTFTQFIFNSLWSERHKYSQPDSAYYYFYRV